MAWDDDQATGTNIDADEWDAMVTYIKGISAVTKNVVTKSGAYTAANNDIVLVSGTVTITLPVPSADDVIDIKNTGTNTITIAAAGGDTIDGDATIYLYSQYEAVCLASDGTNWFMI